MSQSPEQRRVKCRKLKKNIRTVERRSNRDKCNAMASFILVSDGKKIGS